MMLLTKQSCLALDDRHRDLSFGRSVSFAALVWGGSIISASRVGMWAPVMCAAVWLVDWL